MAPIPFWNAGGLSCFGRLLGGGGDGVGSWSAIGPCGEEGGSAGSSRMDLAFLARAPQNPCFGSSGALAAAAGGSIGGGGASSISSSLEEGGG